MKKTFRLVGLDCANCASKMETGISKLPGVSHVSINFMTTKMTLEAEDTQMDTIVDQCKEIITKLEPQVKLMRA